jgi:hypothetical protein
MLRIAAIAANLLFICYGHAADLKPVLLLHCVLLPLNVMRLAGALRERAVPVGGATIIPGDGWSRPPRASCLTGSPRFRGGRRDG